MSTVAAYNLHVIPYDHVSCFPISLLLVKFHLNYWCSKHYVHVNCRITSQNYTIAMFEIIFYSYYYLTLLD